MVVCCGQLSRCDQVCVGVTICHHMKFVTVEVGTELLNDSPLQSKKLMAVGRVLALCIIECSASICNDSGSAILYLTEGSSKAFPRCISVKSKGQAEIRISQDWS